MAASLLSMVASASITLLSASAWAQTVAYYRFENGTANTTATASNSILDSSGNGLNGTPFLSPTYRTVPVANTTLGLQFTGGDQRVFVPDSAALAITQNLTLEALIRFDGTSPNSQFHSQILFRGDDRGGLDPYYLSVDAAGKLDFQVASLTQAASVEAPNLMPIGQYVSVAGTLNDATNLLSLYINGSLVATAATTVRPFATLDSNSSPGFGIGNVETASYHEGFNGIIDEARVSNVALQPVSSSITASAPPNRAVSLSLPSVVCRWSA